MKKRYIALVLAATMLVTLPMASIAHPGDHEPGAAEELVANYFGHVIAGNWEGVAASLDPHEMATLKQFLVDAFAASADGAELVPFLLGQSLEELRSADPAAVFVSLMELAFQFAPDLHYLELDILGGVPEGDDTIHFVVRTHMRADLIELRQVSVVTTRNVAGQWRISMTADIQALVHGFQQILAEQ